MVPAFLPPSLPIYLPNEVEPFAAAELNSVGVASALNSPSFSDRSQAEILLAQAIVPSDIGTVVTPGSNQTDITGGQLSGDGTNLFHNFQEFGLTEAQIANFIASPEIQNILGNVSGGDVSFIDGILQVTGSDANLYLINPAGIIFGANAELNLNGDFTATTADRIGFGHNWLDVLSPDSYQTLIGEPNQFGFTAEQPGNVLNFGTLSVASGQNLALLGGTVVNDGELLAADGNITLLAVPGETLVRINPADTLLGLEISPLAVSNDSPQLNPLSLPALLTGGSITSNELTLVTAPDGTVNIQTTVSAVPLFSGSTAVSGQISTAGGQIALLGDRVSLLGANVDASGSSGGDVRIGGDFQGQGNIPNAVYTLVDSGSQIQADGLSQGDGGRIIVWGDNHTYFSGAATVTSANGNGGFVEISGQNSLAFSGQVDASAVNGTTGTLLLDPTNIEVVATGGDTRLLTDVDDFLDPDLGVDDTTRIDVGALNAANANIELQATNDITFSTDVTTSVGLSAIANNTITVNSDITTGSTLNFEAGTDININGDIATNGDVMLTADTNGDGVGSIVANPGTQLTTLGGAAEISGASLQVANIDTSQPSAQGGDVTLTSAGNIIFEAINTSSNASVDPAGDVTITANGTVRGTGTVAGATGATILATGPAGNGTVQIQHDGGPDNVPFVVGDASENGTADNIAANTVVTAVSAPVLPNGGDAPEVDPATGVTVISVNTPPTLTANSQLPDTSVNQTLTFTLAELNPVVADSNNDNTTLEIAAIPTGTLLRNGVAVQPGDAIASTDPLQFVPPTDATGQMTAFTLRASDGVSQSTVLPVAITLTDAPTITFDPSLDPTIGVAQSPPLPTLETQEQTFVLGMPLAQSPLLEDLNILGAVLPEVPFLIVGGLPFLAGEPMPISGPVNPGFFPNPGLQIDPGSPPPEPSTPEPAGPTPDIPPDPGLPATPPGDETSGTTLPSTAAPVGDLPDPGGTTDTPEPGQPPQEAGATDSATDGTTDGTIALRPEDSVERSDASTAGLNNCQDQVQDINMTPARERTQTVYEGLINCHQQTLARAMELDNSTWIVYTLNNLAISHFVIGDYLTALQFHEQQLEKAIKLDDATQQGIALGGIGAVYGALGDYATAIDHYQRGLDRMPIETAPQWKALIYRNLGNAYFAEKEYERAAEQQQISLDISRGINDTYGEMQAYGNLGHTRAVQGDFAGSIATYEQGLILADELNNDLETAQMLLGLSTAYAYQQAYAQSYGFAQEALAITRDLGARLGEGIALTNMGNSLLYLNRLSEAEQVLVQAITLWESLRAGLGTNDGFKVAIFETQVAAYRNLEEVLVTQNKLETALEIAERGRARAFVELIARGNGNLNEVGATKPPSIEQMRQIAKAQDSTLVEYTIIREQVADTPHGASVQTSIDPEDVQLYIWVVQPTGEINLRQVDLQPFLQTRETSLVELVETSRDLSGIRGFSSDRVAIRPGDQVRRNGEPEDWAPYNVTAIDPQARTVTLSHPDFELPNPVVSISEVYKIDDSAFASKFRPRQHWRDLHQLLIEPIADLLPSDPNARVVFIPQEQLFLVPFPALQAQDGSDLIEHHTILSAPAIQVLGLTSRNQAQSIGQPLVVGNPSPMPDRLQPLPHAGTEADGIADVLAASPLIGDAATETAVKQKLPTASLIHLATHGFFNEAQPLQGALAFVPSDGQDGFLTAEEILTQSLTADLVVLSACDTGRGKITGDGVIGLSRSFLAAGANNVMVSLWQVPDDATAQLMIEFYRQRQNLDNAQALRQAMLTIRQQYSDPAAWAAFTLIGAM